MNEVERLLKEDDNACDALPEAIPQTRNPDPGNGFQTAFQRECGDQGTGLTNWARSASAWQAAPRAGGAPCSPRPS